MEFTTFFAGCLSTCICRSSLLIDNRVNLVDLTGLCHVVQGSKKTHPIRFLSESPSAFSIVKSGFAFPTLSLSMLSIIDFFRGNVTWHFHRNIEKIEGICFTGFTEIRHRRLEQSYESKNNESFTLQCKVCVKKRGKSFS